MQRVVRGLFTRVNILARRFGKCLVPVNIVLLETVGKVQAEYATQAFVLLH